MTMQIKDISSTEFDSFFEPSFVYNTASFARLNASKVIKVHYLAIGEDGRRPRLGAIFGERDGRLLSPFSAPFGGFEQHGKQNILFMESAVGLLKGYAAERQLGVEVTLPPLLYDESQISKCVSVFSRGGFRQVIDLNYYFNVQCFPDYMALTDRSARKNLNRSLKEDFHLVQLDSGKRDDVERAYEVIRRNREEHGYPLRMTLEQVWQTVTSVVKADFFVLEHEGRDVAAAQIFHVAEGIAQVIYWGDIRKYSALRPMNFLAYSILDHYYKQGLRILDIGPSTEDGVPNYGLCEFKENIGCEVTLKYRFVGER